MHNNLDSRENRLYENYSVFGFGIKNIFRISGGGVIFVTSLAGGYDKEESTKGEFIRDDGLSFKLPPTKRKGQYGIFKDVTVHILYAPFSMEYPLASPPHTIQPELDLGNGHIANFHEVFQTYESLRYDTKAKVWALPNSRLIDDKELVDGVVFLSKPDGPTVWISNYLTADSYISIPSGTDTKKALEEIVPVLLKPHMSIDKRDEDYFYNKTIGILLKMLPDKFPEITHESSTTARFQAGLRH